MLRQQRGYPGKNADQGKIQNTLDPECPPAVVMFQGIRGNKLHGTDQGALFIGFSRKAELLLEIDLRVIFYFTYRKSAV